MNIPAGGVRNNLVRRLLLAVLSAVSHTPDVERAERHAEHFDWTGLTSYYREARTLAFQKYHPHLSILPRESKD